MASGDLMLDSSGNVILDASGNDQLSDGTGDACCCGSKCYQLWTAVWNCASAAWTVTAGAKACLPGGTDTSWTGSGCTWQRYVDMSHACTVEGDCTALSDTTEPSPPNGGLEPDGCCCGGCDTCLVDPDPGCCSPCGTPDQITITIVDIDASPNPLCNTASPWDVDILDVSGMVGRSFVMPYAGACGFSYTADVTAWVKVLACDGDSSGCPSCTPTTDITSSVSMTITWTPGSFGPRFSFTVTTTNTIGSGRNLTAPFTLVVNDADDDDLSHTCCQDWTSSCAAAGCPDPSTTDFFNIFITSLAVSPC